MKKLLAVLALGLASSLAFAQGYGAVEVEDGENRVTRADTIGTAVVVGIKDGAWQYSGKLSTSQAEWGNGSVTTGYEARVKRKFTNTHLGPYLGARLGERVESTGNFSYYAIDAGLVVPVMAKFDLDLSYRYRNAFNNSNNFETNRYGIEGKYRLTKQDSLGLRYARSYNDT